MAEKLREMDADPRNASLTYSDELAMLVDAEYDNRQSKRITALLKEARRKYSAACAGE